MEVVEIILVLILAIFGIFNGVKWRSISLMQRCFVITSVLLAVVVGYNGYQKWSLSQHEEKVRATYGDIQDKTEKKDSTITLQIGKRGSLYTLDDGKWILFRGTPFMQVFINKNKLYVSATIRDLEGKVAAVIDYNEWEIINSSFDYNNDDTGLEIVEKGTRKVLFQLDLKDGIVHFSGFVVYEDKSGFFLIDQPELAYVNYGYTSSITTFNDKLPFDSLKIENKIVPLFRYPRAKYLGVRWPN